jgi:hypothetical protein
MTEAEWFSSLDVWPMLQCVRALASDRKLRLWAAACCRRFWDLLGEDAHRAVEVGERFADGLATAEERQAAAATHYTNWPGRGGPGVLWTHPDAHLRVTLEAAARVVTMRFLRRPTFLDGPGRTQDERYQRFTPLLRDVIGNPFRPVPLDPSLRTWNDGLVVRIAEAAYEHRCLPAGTLDEARLAVLADALEEAGANEDILAHCRQQGQVHVRGCWAVDLLLAKE